jgi:hypothetical protein
MSHKMIAVTKDEFFAYIMNERKINIHPSNSAPDVTTWEVVGTREVVGRSWPGWKNPGDPQRYELREDLVKRTA